EKEVAKMATEMLKSEATQMVMSRKEEGLRHWVSVLLSSSVETLLLKTLRAWSNESSRQKLTEALSSQSATLEDLKEELLQARSSESERLASLREELRARSDCIAELQSRDSDRCLELENLLAESRQQTSRAKTEAQEAERLQLDSVEKQTQEVEMMRRPFVSHLTGFHGS
ncbi:unnamed protein product, partial [Durusdinium trenchii]